MPVVAPGTAGPVQVTSSMVSIQKIRSVTYRHKHGTIYTHLLTVSKVVVKIAPKAMIFRFKGIERTLLNMHKC